MTFPSSKICSGCQQDKPLRAWSKHKKMSDGLQTLCKACMKAAHKKHWDGLSPEAKALRWRNNALWTKYRLRPEDFDQMLADQRGLCACCGGDMKRPCVDHVKGTKRVRALLCNQCNAGLGQFHDNPARLVLAAVYLKKHGTE